MADIRSLQPAYYEALRRLTLELAGVKLGSDTEFLVETRLSALARQEGFENLPSMIKELFSEGQTRLAVSVVSALLERDIRFFADRTGFKSLGQTIWPLLASEFDHEPIRILVYGCGSGQDAYSMGMALTDIQDAFPHLTPRSGFKIKGVDYPSRALSRAKAGRFTHFEVQRGLPARKLVKYFKRDKEDWVIVDSLRDHVEFEDFHLLSNPESLGKFHLIVLRNSLARYEAPAQMRILRSLAPIIKPGGYLMLGTSEDLSDLNFGLDPVQHCPGFFVRRESKFREEDIIQHAAV